MEKKIFFVEIAKKHKEYLYTSSEKFKQFENRRENLEKIRKSNLV